MFRKRIREHQIIISLYLILTCSVALTLQVSIEKEHLASQLALVKKVERFKRQQANDVAPQNVNNNNQPTSPQRGTTVAPSEALNNQPDGANEEEKAPEEVLSSLKCDFGTSDVPDLCKFKILDSPNPLSKGLTSWSLGSGKLALYQGGPLIDASDRNDTTGGYIFYETSNIFANQSMNKLEQHQSIEPYSMVATLKGLDSSFQHVSSTRFSVANNVPGPAFVSPNLTAPGPSGMCLSFKYAIQGLSAEELRIHVNDHKTERSRQIWTSTESAGSNWTRGEVLYSVTNKHSIMFSASSGSSSVVKDLQQRKFRGYLALDEIEVNKHDFSGAGESPCKGHCNFDGDLCGWTNAENGQEDDFDWSFGRGSDNLFTGPARDFISSMNNDLTGSYLYTDSAYPRRPGDRAILVSPMFQPTAVNEAMCMRLAVHMFGSGVGMLAIRIKYADPELASATSGPGGSTSTAKSSSQNNGLVIWELAGDAGNSWHQAQTSVSSSKSPFQVLIEGVIGENHLGNIAIDEISFAPGPCPTSPPVASKNYGDCTFEQSMCYWRNPDAEIQLDDLDWIRFGDEPGIHGPHFDHTLKKRSGSYLKLENTFREPKSGTRAFLLSPIFQPRPQTGVQCLSFYYYMFMRSISPSGPNLGTIRVYLASNNELVPIWRLTNPISSPNWKHARASLSSALIDGQPSAPTKLFQIAFEGIWGDAIGGSIALDDITVYDGACDIMPPEARSVPGECTFDVDMCSWLNKTSDSQPNLDSSADSSKSPFLQSVNNVQGVARMSNSSGKKKAASWLLATIDSRPVNLQDHTYKAPIGYAYVDVLDSSNQRVSYILQSSVVTVQSGQQVGQCLSFWFAAYGRQDSNQLSVFLTQASAPPPEDADSQANRNSQPTSGGTPSSGGAGGGAGSGSQPPAVAGDSQPAATAGGATAGGSTADAEAENSNAWKEFDGKLLWSVSLKNITEPNRRKWQYAQTTLKADSNYIVRFVANSNDGGFALDDISYYEGACETRPAHAKIQSDEEETSSSPANQAAPLAKPATSR